jgi:hypothetical protein
MLCLIIRKVGKLDIFLKNYMLQNCRIVKYVQINSLGYSKKDWGPLMVAQWLRYCATNRKVAGSIP